MKTQGYGKVENWLSYVFFMTSASDDTIEEKTKVKWPTSFVWAFKANKGYIIIKTSIIWMYCLIFSDLALKQTCSSSDYSCPCSLLYSLYLFIIFCCYGLDSESSTTFYSKCLQRVSDKANKMISKCPLHIELWHLIKVEELWLAFHWPKYLCSGAEQLLLVMVSRFTTSWLYVGEQVEGSRLNATSVSAFCHIWLPQSQSWLYCHWEGRLR